MSRRVRRRSKRRVEPVMMPARVAGESMVVVGVSLRISAGGVVVEVGWGVTHVSVGIVVDDERGLGCRVSGSGGV